MTELSTARPDVHRPAQEAPRNYLNQEKGIWSWMTTLDHKRIAILYLVTLAVVFLIAGLLALAVRTELIAPGETIMGPDRYNQAFTMHGILMIFGFLVPATPAILGNFVIPMQLGAKDVAFPRLNLGTYYIYLAGGALIFGSLILGSLDTGWTFYAPYSTSATSDAVLFVTLGIFVAGFASILTAVNFIVTIHKMRAPGLTWNRLPLFIWAMYATSIVQILATPVIGITMILLFMERVFQIGIFDPNLGGDPVLYQHFFWFYSHPAVYIMILPGFGIISELIGTFSRNRVFGYTAIALSSVAIAFLGFLVWGHHMLVSGQSAIAGIVFSLISFLIGIPTGIKIFNWVATLYKGSIWLQTPMLYALAFLFLFTIGGLTGIMVAVLAVNVHLHDTYFVIAHIHYVMMGGMMIALIGGMHYWWPKITGKMYNEQLGKVAWLLVFVGFNVTFFPQFILGSQGMPRRYWTYLPEFTSLHALSTYGSYVLAAGLFLILGYAIHSLFWGKRAAQNPWGAATLEWTHAATPPITHNFERTPYVVHGPYDYHHERVPPAPLNGGDGTSTEPEPAEPSSVRE